MAALAQKGVGGERAARFPSPKYHGRAPAPQKRPPCPKHPLPWERRPWACVRPGRKRRKRRKAQPWQPPSAEPSPERGWGPLPMSPEKRGAIGQGGHVRHVLFSTEFFPRLSGSSDGAHRISPTCCRAPQEGTGSPQVLVRGPTRPQGVRPQGRWQWGEPRPKGPVGTVGVQRDTWESVGPAGIPWDRWTPCGTREHPKRSWTSHELHKYL